MAYIDAVASERWQRCEMSIGADTLDEHLVHGTCFHMFPLE